MSVIHEIHLYGTNLLNEGSINKVGEAAEFENLIFVVWLIQSHSQGGAPSTNLGYKNSDRRLFCLSLLKILS